MPPKKTAKHKKTTKPKEPAKSMQPAITAASAAAQTHAATTTSNLAGLPTEIWLNVFSSFSYHQLKNCTMVNRDFKSISEFKIFDTVLFRGPAPLSAETQHVAKDIEVHPVFEEMRYACTDNIDDVLLYGRHLNDTGRYSEEHGMYKITKSSAYNEFATMPALKHLKIKVQSAKAFDIKNEEGVTVQDVLKGIVGFFGAKIDAMLYNVAPWNEEDHFSVHVENRVATRSDCMGDHRIWNGFDEQKVDEDGVLTLMVYFFDS